MMMKCDLDTAVEEINRPFIYCSNFHVHATHCKRGWLYTDRRKAVHDHKSANTSKQLSA
jgi:hypothetical protein